MTETDLRRCACGCSVDQHRHFRPGTDCGECGAAACPNYRPRAPLPISAGLRRLLLVTVGIPASVMALVLIGMLAGAWAVYTLLVVIVIVAIFLITEPDGDRS